MASGADDDLRQDHRRQQTAERRTAAQALLEEAQSTVASDQTAAGLKQAEKKARSALGLFAGSLDWAEGTEEEADAHRQMDEAGAWVRETFGCHLKRTGASYEQTCPVALAHNRIGFSIGGVAVRTCSLCGGDFSDCEHLPGTAYLVPGGAADLGWCRVCLKETCDHRSNEEYRVSVVAIVSELHVEEISLVGTPAIPEARLLTVSVPIADLQDRAR